MESINEGGKTAHEIAQIIKSMNPNITDSETSENNIESRLDNKHRLDDYLYHKELSDIANGDYESHGLFLAKLPKPVNPRSVEAARKGGNKGWTNSNGHYFSK